MRRWHRQGDTGRRRPAARGRHGVLDALTGNLGQHRDIPQRPPGRLLVTHIDHLRALTMPCRWPGNSTTDCVSGTIRVSDPTATPLTRTRQTPSTTANATKPGSITTPLPRSTPPQQSHEISQQPLRHTAGELQPRTPVALIPSRQGPLCSFGRFPRCRGRRCRRFHRRRSARCTCPSRRQDPAVP